MYSNMGDFGENFFKKLSKGPRVTLTLPVKSPMSVWPFIIIPKSATGDNRAGIIEHEKTHWERQGPLSLGWYLRYALDKDFRWREERLAIEKSIRLLQQKKANVNYEGIINTALSSKYRGMASPDTIRNFVYNLRDTNPYGG